MQAASIRDRDSAQDKSRSHSASARHDELQETAEQLGSGSGWADVASCDDLAGVEATAKLLDKIRRNGFCGR